MLKNAEVQRSGDVRRFDYRGSDLIQLDTNGALASQMDLPKALLVIAGIIAAAGIFVSSFNLNTYSRPHSSCFGHTRTSNQ